MGKKRKKLPVRFLNQRNEKSNPLREVNYRELFEELNINEVKEEIRKVLRDSKDWWPADFGHYGPLFVRLAWHSAGTYRVKDGRRGANSGLIRLYPILDWPDNTNLDKALRLLWPVKRKFGERISWGDLVILAGNVALEDMGFKTLGFAGGRVDTFYFEEDVYYQKELEVMAEEKRLKEEKPEELPAAASTMGLIYVNPEGPKGNPDPVESAKEIRESFRLMGMDDEETVALIAGGHSFGKCHGAGPISCLGEPPDEAPVEEAGFGWKNSCGTGKGPDAITSGFELTWTRTPVKWSLDFLRNLFAYDYELTKSPAGLYQWVAKDAPAEIPDAFDPSKKHKPMMLTTDLAIKFDPVYREIALRFLENPEEFEKAFARAWFKLTHRDLGPLSRYLWKEKPEKVFPWQDPLPEPEGEPINGDDAKALKEKVLETDVPLRDYLYVAWSAASSYRDSDKRGGVNGGKIFLEPMKSWEVNEPETVERVLKALRKVKEEFNSESERKVSLSDLLVIAGNLAVEVAAKNAGFDVEVPFYPGRVDAEQEQIDVEFYREFEPKVDGFRNYLPRNTELFLPEELFLDKAQLLTLTPPEMVVLTGGLRVLGGNYRKSREGVLTDKEFTLTNDYFVNLLDPEVKWKAVDDEELHFIGFDRRTGEPKWRATRFDLILAADTELRAVSEVYAFESSLERFVRDFISAWSRLVNLDRFDIFWR